MFCPKAFYWDAVRYQSGRYEPLSIFAIELLPSYFWIKWNLMKWWSIFWVFDFYETWGVYICEKVQEKFSYGFKNLVNLWVGKKKSHKVEQFLIFHAKLQVLSRFLLFLSKKTIINYDFIKSA